MHLFGTCVESEHAARACSLTQPCLLQAGTVPHWPAHSAQGTNRAAVFALTGGKLAQLARVSVCEEGGAAQRQLIGHGCGEGTNSSQARTDRYSRTKQASLPTSRRGAAPSHQAHEGHCHLIRHTRGAPAQPQQNVRHSRYPLPMTSPAK